MPRPDRISFITAAFHQPKRLERAVASLIGQTCPCWEMVISPDDGGDYSRLAHIDPRIRIVPTSEKNTGAGPARNRGRAIASGDYIAVLDDDDTVAGNFVAEVMEALQGFDAVTVPTAYVREDGRLVREVGTTDPQIDIPRFGRELGSMHVICKAGIHPEWQACFAQDVLHTCETISRAGGSIPVVGSTRYFCTIREHSACATRKDICAEYMKLIALRLPALTGRDARDTQQLFEYRCRVNAAFEARIRQELGYHEFVRSLYMEHVPAELASEDVLP